MVSSPNKCGNRQASQIYWSFQQSKWRKDKSKTNSGLEQLGNFTQVRVRNLCFSFANSDPSRNYRNLIRFKQLAFRLMSLRRFIIVMKGWIGRLFTKPVSTVTQIKLTRPSRSTSHRSTNFRTALLPYTWLANSKIGKWSNAYYWLRRESKYLLRTGIRRCTFLPSRKILTRISGSCLIHFLQALKT